MTTSLWSVALFDVLENSEFLVTAGLLILALGGGSLVIFFINRWKKQTTRDKHRSIDALNTYRTMYERGELSKAEYEAIRGHVSSQARNEILDAVHKKTNEKQPP